MPLGVVLIPDEFQVNDAVLAQALKDKHLRREEVDLAMPQRRLSQFCSERAIPLLDLDARV